LPSSTFAREQLWTGLRSVAIPDSRFHYRFSEFIPDFAGSGHAIDAVCSLQAYQEARHVFVTPDNSLIELRRRLLQVGVSLVVSSYNMASGFYLLRPGTVPAGHELYGAWPDGLALDLQALSQLGRFDFVATGASAVSTSGVRFGRGHGFFDLEWRIFSDMGLVNNHTPLATVVHDMQVLDKKLFPSPDDVLVDWICTPTRTLSVPRETPRPRGVQWKDISPEQLQANPALAELHRTVGLA
jgi:5-formyltetrahydrofolate cyclo-ligase